MDHPRRHGGTRIPRSRCQSGSVGLKYLKWLASSDCGGLDIIPSTTLVHFLPECQKTNRVISRHSLVGEWRDLNSTRSAISRIPFAFYHRVVNCGTICLQSPITLLVILNKSFWNGRNRGRYENKRFLLQFKAKRTRAIPAHQGSLKRREYTAFICTWKPRRTMSCEVVLRTGYAITVTLYCLKISVIYISSHQRKKNAE